MTSPTRSPVNGAGPVPDDDRGQRVPVDAGVGEDLGDHRAEQLGVPALLGDAAGGERRAVVVGQGDGDRGGGVECEDGHAASLRPGRGRPDDGQVDAGPARADGPDLDDPVPGRGVVGVRGPAARARAG